MALTTALFAALLACTAVHVAGRQPGFLSIDCGRKANYSGYKSSVTGIDYISDDPYVDGGENHMVAAEYESHVLEQYWTLRSFPSGVRNCYTLPTESGGKYLVRMCFLYGNYDGKDSSSPQFDLHLGTNYWDRYDSYEVGQIYWSEAVFVEWASWAPVCLVNTGGGTPFVSSVELRPLRASLYPHLTSDHSMSTYYRGNMGAQTSTNTRYPYDQYDRFWEQSVDPQWANISTQAAIQPDDEFAVPVPVLQTAITAIGNATVLNVGWRESRRLFKFFHFADFQNGQLRQFNISVDVVDDNNELNLYSPSYLSASCVYTPWFNATDGTYTITLTATAASVLPPVLNAYARDL